MRGSRMPIAPYSTPRRAASRSATRPILRRASLRYQRSIAAGVAPGSDESGRRLEPHDTGAIQPEPGRARGDRAGLAQLPGDPRSVLGQEAVELAVGDAPRDDRLERAPWPEDHPQLPSARRLAHADADRLAVDHEQPRRSLQELNRHSWTLASGVGRERIAS